MRPRHACLGKFDHNRIVRLVDDASMRPRHACLGKCDEQIPLAMHHDASMRPRHACLGKCDCCEVLATLPDRFNEAEACVPRKMTSKLRNYTQIARLQ